MTRGRRKKRWSTKHKQQLFLKAFSRIPAIKPAAKRARVSRSQVYEWQKDPDFQKRMVDAFEDAVDDLVETGHKRAKAGESDRLLEKFLEAYRRKVFGRKVEHSFRDDPNLQTLMRIVLEVLVNHVPKERLSAAVTEFRSRVLSAIGVGVAGDFGYATGQPAGIPAPDPVGEGTWNGRSGK